MLGVLLFATLSFYLAHDIFEHYARFWLETAIGILAIGIGALHIKRAVRGVEKYHTECGCCKIDLYRIKIGM
jgi:cytochrome c biogenesis protein CcdA